MSSSILFGSVMVLSDKPMACFMDERSPVISSRLANALRLVLSVMLCTDASDVRLNMSPQDTSNLLTDMLSRLPDKSVSASMG